MYEKAGYPGCGHPPTACRNNSRNQAHNKKEKFTKTSRIIKIANNAELKNELNDKNTDQKN